MRRSFVRLTVRSALVGWAVCIAAIAVFTGLQTWTEDHARRSGVFLAYELLNQEPASNRASRLRTLQPNFAVTLSIMTAQEVEGRVGRPVLPSEKIPLRVSNRTTWFFVVFEDGQSALAAGPVNPAVPVSTVPIGLILAIIGLPAIAAIVSLRVERELTKIERANEALAVGEFSARVDNARGPSNELAASFNAMAERIERLVRSRDELVQAVSHELGSPLSRLRFHLELLDNPSPTARQDRTSAMTRELDALDELVAELLSYVQSDELELKPNVFSPNQILSDLAELAKLEAPDDRTIDVDLQLPDDAHVYADQRLFQRATENVLRNAVRHAHNKVQLEVQQDAAGVRVTVHDDGPGIPEDLREKVMAPFVRLEANRDRKTGGVGLGLAIVSRIVNRHGGRLEIGISPLKGAAVTTVWPQPG